MSLELSLLDLLVSGEVDPIEVGRLPEPVTLHLGAKMPQIYLSGYSYGHILERHAQHLSPFDLLWVPFAVRDGLWVTETARTNCACFTWINPETQIRYLGAVKVTAAGFETYLTTFHRARPRQTASILRRGPILQKHR